MAMLQHPKVIYDSFVSKWVVRQDVLFPQVEETEQWLQAGVAWKRPKKNERFQLSLENRRRLIPQWYWEWCLVAVSLFCAVEQKSEKLSMKSWSLSLLDCMCTHGCMYSHTHMGVCTPIWNPCGFLPVSSLPFLTLCMCVRVCPSVS